MNLAEITHARTKLPTLTPSQRTVLEKLGTGGSNAEIAALLHRSPATVENHVLAVCKALGVTSRTKAAVLAVKLGLA